MNIARGLVMALENRDTRSRQRPPVHTSLLHEGRLATQTHDYEMSRKSRLGAFCLCPTIPQS